MYSKIRIKKQNFKAELPCVVSQIISVERDEGQIRNSPIEKLQYETYNKYYTECYSVVDNMIYFSGSFSQWWIIRIYQKIKELLKPVMYTITYKPSVK